MGGDEPQPPRPALPGPPKPQFVGPACGSSHSARNAEGPLLHSIQRNTNPLLPGGTMNATAARNPQPLLSAPAKFAGAIAAIALLAGAVNFAGDASHEAVHVAHAAM